MKTNCKVFILSILTLVLFFSCQSEPSKNGNGKPAVISYVRFCSPAVADSAIYQAEMLKTIAIIGTNLQAVQSVKFDETEAVLNPTLVTETAIIVSIPFAKARSSRLILTTADGLITGYDFITYVPNPQLDNLKCEYAYDGEEIVINGSFFYEPLTVLFTDSATGGLKAEIADFDNNQITVTVPAGAKEGPLTVTSCYGSTVSDFKFRDKTGLISDFRELRWGNSWEKGAVSNENPCDGNYLLFQVDALGGWVWKNELSGVYWAADGNGNKPVATGDITQLALRFEANIINWHDVPMLIWFGNNSTFSVDGEEAKLQWYPFVTSGNATDGWTVANYTTNGWTTFTFPLTQFCCNKAGYFDATTGVTDRKLGDISSFTDINLMIFGPQCDATAKYPVHICIDNLRIVPYKE